MRQTFVHTAEVVPALPHPSSSLYSPPFAQLAVGARAQAVIHFVAIILHSIYNSSSITYKYILLPFSHRTAEGSITLKLSYLSVILYNPKCSQPSHLIFEHCKQCLYRYASIVFFFRMLNLIYNIPFGNIY